MTEIEKSKEIERICEKLNKYAKERTEEITILEDKIREIKKEKKATLEKMIVAECKKKGISLYFIQKLLKDIFYEKSTYTKQHL